MLVMKRMLFPGIVISLLLIFSLAFKLASRTNTIFAIKWNHGIVVPKSTSHIDFHSYRWFINICLDGNGSVVKCEMNKNDFESFLQEQEWCQRGRSFGGFQKMPDSLIGKYPLSDEELKSNVADALLVSANEIGSDRLEVWFFTDCN